MIIGDVASTCELTLNFFLMWGETLLMLAQIVGCQSPDPCCLIAGSIRLCLNGTSGLISQGRDRSQIELDILEMHEDKYFSATAGQVF
jgi:hypothetical protein